MALKELQRFVAEVESKTETVEFRQEGIPIVEAEVSYPVVTYKGLQKNAAVLSRFYSDGAQSYLKFVKKQMLPVARKFYVQSVRIGDDIRVFEANQSFSCTYNSGLISIFYDQYEYTGGVHGGTVRFADTFHLAEGRFIRLKELFLSGVRYKKVLVSLIIEQIEKQIEHGGAFYYDNYRRAARRYFSVDQFYLQPGGLVIYYQQYTLAPYSMGLPTFFIPYSSLNNLLRYELALNTSCASKELIEDLSTESLPDTGEQD